MLRFSNLLSVSVDIGIMRIYWEPGVEMRDVRRHIGNDWTRLAAHGQRRAGYPGGRSQEIRRRRAGRRALQILYQALFLETQSVDVTPGPGGLTN